jgi:apolipoprotein N-acyltransferase
VALLALAPALAGWLLHAGVHRAGVPIALALPLAWSAAEWARGSLPGGFAFPWAGTALTLTGSPRALALLPWIGEHGVTLWIALVNGLVTAAVVRRGAPSRARLVTVLAAGGVAALPMAIPPLLPTGTQAPAAPTVRVAVLQTAVPFGVRLDPTAGADAMAAAVENLLARVDAGSVEVVVLPETAFPLPLESAAGRVHLTALQRHAARLGAPLAVGALGTSAGLPPRPLNSVFVVDSTGISGRYDKRRLVPVIERNPLVGSRALALLGDTTSYEIGGRRAPLRAGDLQIGALVCFESAFGGLARDPLRSGARLLINVTNDAWFGGGLPGAAARAQHEAHARLRALEGGAPLVRSANGGRSLWIDRAGRVTAVARSGEEGVAVALLTLAEPPSSGRLWLQGVVGPAAALATLLVLALGDRRRRASPARAPSDGPVFQARSG